MLKFVFTDINEKEIVSKLPLELTVNIEEDVPADDMVAVFEYFDCDELKDIKIFDDDTRVFTGIVDEQQTIIKSSGKYLKIIARSMAAKLLDNESVPVSYMHPSTEIIAARHLHPFGLKVDNSDNTTYFGTQTVIKGSTNYKAVDDFAKNAFNSTLRVNELGEVEFSNRKSDVTTIFSNSGNGIKYLSFFESVKRCEEISAVRIKVVNSCGYNNVIKNADACARKIQRERYLNAVHTDTPASYADSMIKMGRKKAYTLTLECEGQHLRVFKTNAVVRDTPKGELSELYVSGLRYHLSANENITVVTLKRKEV